MCVCVCVCFNRFLLFCGGGACESCKGDRSTFEHFFCVAHLLTLTLTSLRGWRNSLFFSFPAITVLASCFSPQTTRPVMIKELMILNLIKKKQKKGQRCGRNRRENTACAALRCGGLLPLSLCPLTCPFRFASNTSRPPSSCTISPPPRELPNSSSSCLVASWPQIC